MTKPERAILLIEDSVSDVELTRRALERARIGNPLVVAEDGEQALAYLAEAQRLPAVALLDLKLPRIPGLEVLRRIRADARTRRLPVVILTSSREEHDLATSYDLGVNSYIRKRSILSSLQSASNNLGCIGWFSTNSPAVTDE